MASDSGIELTRSGPARWLLLLLCLVAACGPARRGPPSKEQAFKAVWAFLGAEVRGNQQAAWALLGRCDVPQASDTSFVTLEPQIIWQLSSNDTALAMVEYDVLGDAYPAPAAPVAGRSTVDRSLTFRPGVRRISELFGVVWDSGGQPVLACGLHQANHVGAQRFHLEMFGTADSSRAKWDAARPRR